MSEKNFILDRCGVEIGQEFGISGYPSYTFKIDNDGRIYGQDESDRKAGCWINAASAVVCDIINDPSIIIRRPQYTETERLFSRVLQRYGYIGIKLDENGRFDLLVNKDRPLSGVLPFDDVFPTLAGKRNISVMFSDILGEQDSQS